MIRAQSVAALALGFVLFTAGVSAQSGGSLKGAWRVVEVTAADGKVDASPQPGLYVFTDRHYSIQRVLTARAAYPEKPTDKDKVAAFDPFIANSGTYEVKGNVLMTKALVAKIPNVMTGPGGKSELKFEGTSTVYVMSTNPAGAKTVVKLQRVE
jgi:Lipocalin-like domain